MKITVTDQISHKVNSDYQGVLVQFDASDKNFFAERMNWLPKSSEAYALHKLMFALDSKYRSLLRQDHDEVMFLVQVNQDAIKELGKEVSEIKKYLAEQSKCLRC
jgi:hypothetical protein